MSTTTLDQPTTDPAVTLALSLCDRCGAAGRSRATLPSGQDLVLCGHHTTEYGPGLLAADATVTTLEG